MRGRGLPACGSGVTVPISTKPKPRPSSASGTSACLSKPGAIPDRIGEVEPEGPHRAAANHRAAAVSRGATFRAVDGERMGVFGIENPEQRPGQTVEKANHHGLRIKRRRTLSATIALFKVGLDSHPLRL